MKQDYYDTLGVSKSATQADIKKAYRKLALKYHPDRNKGNAEAERKFKEAAEAHSILSNPSKRQQYDRFGHSAFENAGAQNMDDIFSTINEMFGSSFGFGSSRQSRTRPSLKGEDLRIKVKLKLEEIVNGTEKKLKIKRKVMASGVRFGRCSNCNGTGQVRRVAKTILGYAETQTTCNVCNGIGQVLINKPPNSDQYGRVTEEQTVTVSIGQGVKHGDAMEFPDKGNEAPMGGQTGSLIVIIEELEHDVFTRDGKHLHYDQYISIPEAILGANKEIELLNGKTVRIDIKPGVQSGKTLRLRGKGLSSSSSYYGVPGDLLVHLNVWTPQAINREQKDFFEQMIDDPNFLPDPKVNEKSFFERVRSMFS